jgi:hypothetical protein
MKMKMKKEKNKIVALAGNHAGLGARSLAATMNDSVMTRLRVLADQKELTVFKEGRVSFSGFGVRDGRR